MHPPLRSSAALAAWAVRRSGRLESVNWAALAREANDEIVARVARGWTIRARPWTARWTPWRRW